MKAGNISKGPSRQQPFDPLKRSPVACNRCRGRKTKCMGMPPDPCMACLDAKEKCVYAEAEKRVLVPEAYLLSLEARVSELDTSSPKASVNAIPISIAAENSKKEDDNDDADDESLFMKMDNLFLSRSGEVHYIGSSSSTYLAKQLGPASANLAWDMHPMYNDQSWLRQLGKPNIPRLPPQDFARRLYYAQYMYIGTIFSFLQPHHFEERLQVIYGGTPDLANREKCLEYCQMILIFAYGQMYSVNQWSGHDGPPGFDYFKHALLFLPAIHEEGSILFVEVLSLIGYFMQNLNRRDAAFLYIGLALRMAISLGLHQEVSANDIGAVEREHRRRVWWSVYSMDRILCVKSGNPVTIHDEDIDVAWPSPILGEDIDPSPPLVLSHYTRLSQILGRIGEEAYRKKHKSGTNLLTSVQNTMKDLSNWQRNLPSQLQLDFSSLDRNLSREAVSTLLHYYQCINMATRPLIFHVVKKRLEAFDRGSATAGWQEGLPANVIAIIDSSISAARTSTLVMDAAARQNLWATYGFMDGEHAFSAALLLVMVNAAFPYNDRDAASMLMALSVLQGMAEKGNEHIRARHSLLVDLVSAIGPRSSRKWSHRSVDAAEGSNFNPRGFPDPPPMVHMENNLPGLTVPPLSAIDAPLFQEMSFDFNSDEDPSIWEDIVLGNDIDIEMDTDWIQNTLREVG